MSRVVTDPAEITELKLKTIAPGIERAFLVEQFNRILVSRTRIAGFNPGDELFTEAGFKCYAEDLLGRMTNPYLGDTIARVTRDAVRKLEIDGRIFGTIQLAMEYGIEPEEMSLGTMAGVAVLLQKAEEYNMPDDLLCCDWRKLDEVRIGRILKWLWNGKSCRQVDKIIKSLKNAKKHLEELANSFHSF